MTENRIFEVESACIDSGITLIEASAGTGKTFAIAGMVVRLVAEKGYALSQILVVTFTEAATQELRERVRSRIREAVLLLEEGRPEQEPALGNLVQAGPERQALAARSLKSALLGFDEAAIFTIHGFCQRMLRENAFETGALFDVELVTDAEPVWRETAEDFWRKQFYPARPEIGSLVVALQAQGTLTTDGLVELLRKVSRHPELEILSGEESSTLAECERELERTVVDLRKEWNESKSAIAGILRETTALSVNQKDGYSPAVIESLLEDLSGLEDPPRMPAELWKVLEKLSARELRAKTKKKKATPEHPFFDLCETLQELIEAFVRHVRKEFMEFLQSGLDEAKKRRNVITFDDLLTKLYQALKASGGEALATAIGGRFSAALIDEFQDTDPVQWEIFYRVFGGGRHALYLIGDPKQAIYGFRGADIFTYMEARSKATARYTLGTNWRSDKKLVEGANRLFSQHQETFVFSDITFSKVDAAEKEKAEELDPGESGLSGQPLQLACVASEDGGQLTTAAAKARILDLMLAEIQRLLTGNVKLGDRLLEPGDIAILVRTNREAESVREQLVGAGIPAVVRTDRSVLQTEEASHMLRLLAAILEPHKNGLVKTALVSPLFGFDAGRIDTIDGDENAWQDLTTRFHHWQELWSRYGFMRMFRDFGKTEQVSQRLLALRDGERMVTNYNHIAECIHSMEYERLLTPSTLTRWLREQIEGTEGNSDSYVIRLEKDEKAVQIVTIHRSKGLEYSVVFCPFNWTSVVGANSSRDILFHDPANENRLTWDLRQEPDPAHVTAFRREQLAEAIRLLYVAVTRARNRCYLFWAMTRDSGNGANCALAHTFGCGSSDGPDSSYTAFLKLAEAGAADIHEPLDGGEERFYRLDKMDASGLAARKFERELPQSPLITSFSGLVARAHEEAPDRDALPEVKAGEDVGREARADTGPSIFTFPKGAKAGNFFHGLLEKLDFTRPEEIEQKVASQLETYRFDPVFAPIVTTKLKELFSLPLPGGLKLGEVAMEDKLIEAPFYFPIQPVTPTKLATVFKHATLPKDFSNGLGRLSFHPVDGYMTGFIDLVVRHKGRYYVIDWKSNWLGEEASVYGEQALGRTMGESFYYLQYHLYTLAIDRHLASTLPDYSYDRDFGGVLYLFLRGIDWENPKSGVFYDRPSQELIGELRRSLLKEKEKETEPAR